MYQMNCSYCSANQPFDDLGEGVFFEIISLLDAVSISHFLSASRNLWKHRWRLITACRIVPYHECIRNKSWNQGMSLSVENSHFAQMLWFIEKGANAWNEGLKAAVRSRNINLIEFFINKNTDVSCGISEAAFVGNLELVHYLIATYNVGFHDWETLMESAALGGHPTVVEAICDLSPLNSFFDKSLIAAATVGHKDLLLRLLDNRASNDLQNALYWASFGGHREIASVLVKTLAQQHRRGGNFEADCDGDSNRGLFGAARGGHVSLAEAFINRGATNLDMAILEAAAGKQSGKIIPFLVSCGANLDYALSHALEKSKKDEIHFLVTHGFGNINLLLKRAAHLGDGQLVDFLLEKGANDYTGALHWACRGRHYNFVDYFIQKGADVRKAAKYLAEEGNSELIEYFMIQGLGDFTEELNEATRYRVYPIAKVVTSS